MNKVHFRTFLALIFFGHFTLFGSQPIDRELANNVARAAHGLFAGCPITQYEMQDILSEIEQIAKIKKQHNDHDYDDNYQNTVSGDTPSSISSQEAIDGFATIMDLCFEEPDKTPAKQKERKKFIDMLHSLENTIAPEIMTKAIVMISEKLFA
jgi:hypothetical protein